MSKVVGDDPDSCIPAPLKDFVFDLHDSARRSQVPSEQSAQYNGQFTDLSNKYFAQSAWPSPESIASECSNDPLFLAFYKELTHRHLHSVTRISVQDRVNGWHVYRELFDLLLQEAESETKQTQPSLYILPEWAFDILHEFVYQFQGFCQFRTQNAANKIAQQEKENNNKGETSNSKSSSNLDNTMEILRSNQDAWAVESVLYYLNRLVALSSSNTNSNNLAYRHLSIFSSVALSRLECLMGDYRGSLNAASHLLLPNDDEEESSMSIVNEVFPAKLSLSYHAGISYLMLRRYKDACRILEDICVLLQRGFKTGMLRKLHESQNGGKQGSFDQFVKLFDRMICLLAILTHICPISQKKMDDGIKKQIRDKHANQLSKIEQGEEGYEELFMYACPKFISPACPDYEAILEQKDTATVVQAQGPQDAYRLQIKQFMLEMTQQQSLRKLRSYMKLYTSIEIGKLAAFNDTVEDDFLARLVSFKHKMNQLEASSTSSTDDEENNDTDDAAAAEAECMGSALDIHYHINKNMVHVDEAEKLRRFETYFLKGIQINQEVLKDVSTIETAV